MPLTVMDLIAENVDFEDLNKRSVDVKEVEDGSIDYWTCFMKIIEDNLSQTSLLGLRMIVYFLCW